MTIQCAAQSRAFIQENNKIQSTKRNLRVTQSAGKEATAHRRSGTWIKRAYLGGIQGKYSQLTPFDLQFSLIAT